VVGLLLALAGLADWALSLKEDWESSEQWESA
jgi:hypothetical protein